VRVSPGRTDGPPLKWIVAGKSIRPLSVDRRSPISALSAGRAERSTSALSKPFDEGSLCGAD
jgi:hypothetical protein